MHELLFMEAPRRTYAELDDGQRAYVWELLGPPFAEGNLANFPQVPSEHMLICSCRWGHDEMPKLCVVANWDDVRRLQENGTQVRLTWYFGSTRQHVWDLYD